MSYQALYRLYRPQKFSEVVGQTHIVKTLENAIRENKISHAYLFTGPRGTGKTTIAKLLAKGLNCLHSIDGKPCGECENCRAIANGTFQDVIEFDAASNNGVDDAKELIDEVRYAPIKGRYKVYIIDEVHNMSDKAFNALLKTLEEPPENVVFIFATTEAHKVLPTITSRCQRFDFGRIPISEISRKIVEILNKENINFDKDLPRLIASLADGGVRDALGILDQTIAFAGRNISCNDVRQIYGLVSLDNAEEYLKLIVNNDVTNALKLVSAFDSKGVDFVRFFNYLIDVLKELIVYKKSLDTSIFKNLDETHAKSLSMLIDSQRAFFYIDQLLDGLKLFRQVNEQSSVCELTTIKMCNYKGAFDKTPDIVVTKEPVYVEETKENVPEIQVEKQVFVEEEIKVVQDDSNSNRFIFEVEEEQENKVVEEEPESVNVEPVNNPFFIKEPEPIKEKVIDEPNEVIIEAEQEEKVSEEPVKEEVISYPLPQDSEIKSYVLNVMAQANKDDKINFTNKWPNIRLFTYDQTYGEAAKLLLDSVVYVACKDCIIFGYTLKERCKLVNSHDNYFLVKDFLIKLLGIQDIKFIAITENEFKVYRIDYIGMFKSNTVPPIVPINDLYPTRPSSIKVSTKVEKKYEGESLFGSVFQEEE